MIPMLVCVPTRAQTGKSTDSLLNLVAQTDSSRNIIHTEAAKTLKAYGPAILPTLATFFTDTSKTKVISDCHNFYRNLTKGEIAIIMADHIEGMPYYMLTGIQNCLVEFCENNPNKIEYYLPMGEYHWQGETYADLQRKYTEWLAAKDRKETLKRLKKIDRKIEKRNQNHR